MTKQSFSTKNSSIFIINVVVHLGLIGSKMKIKSFFTWCRVRLYIVFIPTFQMLYCKSLSGDKAKSLCIAIHNTLVRCFWCVLGHCHWCILYLYFGLGCYLSTFVPASAHDGSCYFMLYVPVIQQRQTTKTSTKAFICNVTY